MRGIKVKQENPSSYFLTSKNANIYSNYCSVFYNTGCCWSNHPLSLKHVSILHLEPRFVCPPDSRFYILSFFENRRQI